MDTLILLYVTVAEGPTIFADADTRIAGKQIGDHEIKQQYLLITPSFFLRDITCLTVIPVNLKPQKASRSKINFPKIQTLLAGSSKKELKEQDKWYGHNFSLRFLGTFW